MGSRFAYLLVTVVILAAQPVSADFHGRTSTASDSGVSVSFESVFQNPPFSGFVPVRVRIKNNSGRSRMWTLYANSGGNYSRGSAPSSYRQSLSVPEGSEQEFELYVPVLSALPPGRSWRYGGKSLELSLQGYGIKSATLRGSSNFHHYGKKALPFIAMSSRLHLRSWPVLKKSLDTSGFVLTGTKFEANRLPIEWRGYVGLWALLISAEEWKELHAASRSALIDWILMGGRLHIFHQDRLPNRGKDYGGFYLPGTTAKRVDASLGLGTISLFIWDGKELSTDYQVNLMPDKVKRNNPVVFNDIGREYGRTQWSLANRIPELTVPGSFLAVLTVFLLIYFLMVGPLNIRVFARKQERLLLFVTTPVFSIACSILLCVLLAMREGFGGWGLRTTGVYLMPDAKRAVVVQEQAVRTALIFSTSFSVDQDMYLTPIRFDGSSGKQNPRFSLRAREYHGDWFANRSVLGHFGTFVEPSRASIEVIERTKGAEPAMVVLSSINTTLEELYVKDFDGQVYWARDIPAGARTTLVNVHPNRISAFRRTMLDRKLGPKLKTSIRQLELTKGYFVATTKNDPGFVQETLETINWKEDNLFFYGSLPGERSDALGSISLKTSFEEHFNLPQNKNAKFKKIKEESLLEPTRRKTRRKKRFKNLKRVIGRNS